MNYVSKRVSNYEGFKSLDKLLENIDSGKLKPPDKAKVEYWCNLCRCMKKSQRLVPSRVMGRPVTQLGVGMKTGFRGRFVLCCDECARDLEKARVA